MVAPRANRRRAVRRLTNDQEADVGSDPNDTDADGATDLDEAHAGTNPLDPDEHP
jgi:hypothetical protein